MPAFSLSISPPRISGGRLGPDAWLNVVSLHGCWQVVFIRAFSHPKKLSGTRQAFFVSGKIRDESLGPEREKCETFSTYLWAGLGFRVPAPHLNTSQPGISGGRLGPGAWLSVVSLHGCWEVLFIRGFSHPKKLSGTRQAFFVFGEIRDEFLGLGREL